MHHEWTRKAARSFYLASVLWVQAHRLKRMVKPAIIADKLAFLEWNAKEAQRLASNGDSHGMYCVVRALAGRTQNGVALPVRRDQEEMRNESSDGRNNLQGSSGDKCATSAGYAMSMSRSPLSRVDCSPSLTMKQSPTLCWQNGWPHQLLKVWWRH